jgi:RHS repeat-associated protein
VRQFVYDNRGFLEKEQHPEKGAAGGGWTFYKSYDPMGHVLELRDGQDTASEAVTYSYDKAGRLLTVRGNGQLLKRFTYDEAAGGALAKGKVTTAEAWTYYSSGTAFPSMEVEEKFVYDGRGGAASQRVLEALLGTTSIGLVYQNQTWHELGGIQDLSYPYWTTFPQAPQRTVSYGYTRGFLTSVSGFASNLTYHDNLTLASIERTNGVTDWIGKDPDQMQRPASIATSGVLAGKNWSSGTYRYDGSGNIAAIGTNRFAYDGVSRLVGASIWIPDLNPSLTRFDDGFELASGCNFETRVPDPGCYDGPQTKGLETYQVDPFGNLVRRDTTVNGNATYVLTDADAGTNRLTSAGYDARGNMLTWNGASYEFDLLNRMTRMRNGTEDWIFGYDADGERIGLVAQAGWGQVTWTFRDLGGNVLRDYTAACIGCPISWSRDNVYRGGQLLASVEPHQETPLAPDSLESPAAPAPEAITPPDEVRHLTLDHLGTPRLVTDESGEKVAYHAYWPYGREASLPTQNGMRHKFTGHERDRYNATSTADDLDYMHARLNSPLTGRMLSVDPANESAAMDSPQTWNRYAYAYSNPLLFVDPDGQSGVKFLVKALNGAYRVANRSTAVRVASKRPHAVKVVGAGSSGKARRLAKEANPDASIVRHDPHRPGDLPHYQPSSGGTGHVGYSARDIASGLTLAHYAANQDSVRQFLAELVDFVNPLSIGQDMFDLWDMFMTDGESSTYAESVLVTAPPLNSSPFVNYSTTDPGLFLWGVAAHGHHTGNFVSTYDLFQSGAVCIEGVCR